MTTPQPSLVIRIPPPIWAVALLVIALLLDRTFDWEAIITLRARLIGFTLICIGLALAAWARLIFAKVGTEIMPSSAVNAKLVTHGPFRFSRNPMYAGGILLTAGIALVAGTLPFYLAAAILFWLLNAVFIPFEESKMERQYGQQFVDYKARVRRWV